MPSPRGRAGSGGHHVQHPGGRFQVSFAHMYTPAPPSLIIIQLTLTTKRLLSFFPFPWLSWHQCEAKCHFNTAGAQRGGNFYHTRTRECILIVRFVGLRGSYTISAHSK